MSTYKVIAISQARMGSTRLPGKVFCEINGVPLLKIHLDRVAASSRVDAVVVAVPETSENDALAQAVLEWGYAVSRGSEHDVLSRFVHAAEPFNPLYIVRVTSDCPFIDPELIDQVIARTLIEQADYCSNTLVEHFPDGQDIEVMTFAALKMAHDEATLKSDREHVTPWLKRASDVGGRTRLHAVNFDAPDNFNHVRMCVDEPSDLEVARMLAKVCGLTAGWQTYTETYLQSDEIQRLNAAIVRNEGYLKSLNSDEEV